MPNNACDPRDVCNFFAAKLTRRERINCAAQLKGGCKSVHMQYVVADVAEVYVCNLALRESVYRRYLTSPRPQL